MTTANNGKVNIKDLETEVNEYGDNRFEIVLKDAEKPDNVLVAVMLESKIEVAIKLLELANEIIGDVDGE